MAQEAPAPEGETPAAETEPKDNANTPSPESTESPQIFDKDYVKQLRSENASWRIKAQQAEEKAQEFEDAQKSELEKAQTKATRLEQKAVEAEARLLRFEIASEKQIPADALDLLNGSSREELEASADKILNLVKSRNTNDTPDFDGGARETAPDADPETAHNAHVLAMLGLQPK